MVRVKSHNSSHSFCTTMAADGRSCRAKQVHACTKRRNGGGHNGGSANSCCCISALPLTFDNTIWAGLSRLCGLRLAYISYTAPQQHEGGSGKERPAPAAAPMACSPRLAGARAGFLAAAALTQHAQRVDVHGRGDVVREEHLGGHVR